MTATEIVDRHTVLPLCSLRELRLSEQLVPLERGRRGRRLTAARPYVRLPGAPAALTKAWTVAGTRGSNGVGAKPKPRVNLPPSTMQGGSQVEPTSSTSLAKRYTSPISRSSAKGRSAGNVENLGEVERTLALFQPVKPKAALPDGGG